MHDSKRLRCGIVYVIQYSHYTWEFFEPYYSLVISRFMRISGVAYHLTTQLE